MKIWGSVLLAAGMTVSLVVPASAAIGVLKDKRGDTVASVDWTRLAVTNTPNAIKARVDFVKLPARGLRDPDYGKLDFYATVVIETYDVAEWRHYFVSAYRGADGRTRTKIVYNDASGYSNARCAGLKVRWVAGRGGHVDMVVPRSCLQVSRSIAASARTGSAVVDRLYDTSSKKVLVAMN